MMRKMWLKPSWGIFIAALLFFAVRGVSAVRGARAPSGDSPGPAKLGLAQILAGMQSHSRMQDRLLQDYRTLRSYTVQYQGLGTISARMRVEVSYDTARGKRFQIVSQSGSKLLRDLVLKRAIDSEIEASKDKNSTALSPANYRFHMLGSGAVNGRTVYILGVDPLKPEKFLYRGTIWVDAASFGVVKIEAAPAKNPSFWISHAEIHVTNELTDGFWLPEETRSWSNVRLGGTALLTIDYGRYQIASPVPVAGPKLLPAEGVEAASGQ